MSLLSQYESSKGLQGFTLGFHKFFDAFKVDDTTVRDRYSYTWNDIRLSWGNLSIPQPNYIVKPCSCIKDPIPLGGYIPIQSVCQYCGHEPILGPSKKVYSECGVFGSRDATFIPELSEFANEQLKWVQSEPIQTQYKTNKRQLREECQRRINFFVQALHTYFTGRPKPDGSRGTLDPSLRDIRNLAHLCLKE